MNALGPTTRRGVETGIAAVLARVLGVSEVGWDDVDQAPSPSASGAFSVRIASASEMAASPMTRGRKSTGIGMDLSVLVRFAWRIAPKARIESRREALDRIDLMQTSLMSTTAPELLGMSLREWSDTEGDQTNWRIWDVSLTVSTVLDYPATAAA